MAITWFTGFEGGDTLFHPIVGTASITGTVTGGTPRSGGYALKVNPTTSATGYLSNNDADIAASAYKYASGWFYFHTKPASGSEEIAHISRGTTPKLSVRLDSAGNLSCWDGTTQLGSTGGTTLSADTWYFLSLKCQWVSGAPGGYELVIDSTVELSGTRTWTNTGVIQNLILGKLTNRNSQSIEVYYDDWATSDSAYPPSGKVLRSKPTGNGTFTAWTGDYTPEWTEDPPVTTDDAASTQYVETSTLNNAETATFQSFSTIGGGASDTINAVGVMGLTKFTGTSASVKLRLRNGSTNVDSTGANAGPAAGPYIFTSLFHGVYRETDPNTSAAWTISGFNTIEAGCVHNQSQARAIRCTAVFVEVHYTPSAGPAAYDLQAAPGTYTLTGFDDANLATRILEAAIGTYTLTGVGADLVHGYTLLAAAGSYSISGLSSSLLAARILNTVIGTYAVTGANSDLLSQRLLNAATGSYVITGVDALDVAQRLINAGAGSYLLTGADALDLAMRILNADPGSYVLVGFDALLLYTSVSAAFTLDAAPGAYAISGADSLLLAQRLLNAGSGSYGVSGANANFISERLLNAGIGQYQITGQGALNVAQRLLNAGIGQYVLTGSDALDVAQRLMNAGLGAYAITGASAAELAQRFLNAVPGSYAIVGFDATLLFSPPTTAFTMDAQPGVYAISGRDALLAWSGDVSGVGQITMFRDSRRR